MDTDFVLFVRMIAFAHEAKIRRLSVITTYKLDGLITGLLVLRPPGRFQQVFHIAQRTVELSVICAMSPDLSPIYARDGDWHELYLNEPWPALPK